MNGLDKYPETLHADYGLVKRPDHNRVHDDPPLHHPRQDIEHLREAARPADKCGVEPPEIRKDVNRIALEELNTPGAGSAALPAAQAIASARRSIA